MTEIWSRQWHVEYGRHSGIPECCIEYFIESWWKKGRKLSGYDPGTNYVRCPRCVATDNLVEARRCETDCCVFQKQLREHWGVTDSKERLSWQPSRRAYGS